jgi:hypothetical protein
MNNYGHLSADYTNEKTGLLNLVPLRFYSSTIGAEQDFSCGAAADSWADSQIGNTSHLISLFNVMAV